MTTIKEQLQGAINDLTLIRERQQLRHEQMLDLEVGLSEKQVEIEQLRVERNTLIASQVSQDAEVERLRIARENELLHLRAERDALLLKAQGTKVEEEKQAEVEALLQQITQSMEAEQLQHQAQQQVTDAAQTSKLNELNTVIQTLTAEVQQLKEKPQPRTDTPSAPRIKNTNSYGPNFYRR